MSSSCAASTRLLKTSSWRAGACSSATSRRGACAGCASGRPRTTTSNTTVGERLTGTTAVVTGASRGIGRAVARALTSNGATVAMIARGAEALRAAASAIGSPAIAVPCDISRAESVADAMRTIASAFGSEPDVLVNNAGTFALAPIDEVDPDDFGDELETNLVAPLRLIRAVLPAMKARRDGHIVTIGSIADR